MKTLQRFDNYSLTLPILADNILEFHAARLLLLLNLCGNNGRIRSLTKMAKLDFFVRYPKFFDVASKALGQSISSPPSLTVESNMVRYHYGPWDQRYYQVLAFMESRGLIRVDKDGKTFELSLTKSGSQIANNLSLDASFEDLCNQMRNVKQVLGDKSGSQLKNLVYKLFNEEVAQLPLEKVIE